MKRICITTVCIAAVLTLSPLARADKQVSASFNLPIHINAIINETGCKNSPGPKVTLSGEIVLGSLSARLTFSNNAKGTHRATVNREYDVALFLGSSITIPKQPVLGGVGGNPHLYLQFHDGAGTDMTDEVYLGRCVQGLKVTDDLLSAALAVANVHAEGCSNNPGPYITLGGDLVLSGLHARIIFRNNVKGTHTAESSADVTIIQEGTTITLPKQPPLGGVGGNPIISIQFMQGDTLIGDPTVLGRCVQI